MKFHCARWIVLGSSLVLSLVAILPGQTKKQDPAVDRARKQTKMLDDLYKTAIVLITQHYVEGDAPPAVIAGQLLWKEMKAKGHHEVKLIDATGNPNDADNSPADEFEKSAVKELVAGKASVDQVVEKDGKRYLRTATAVPVVMDKCVACHAHYKNVPKGQAIGALGYIVPVE